MILVGRISLIVVQIKNFKHEENIQKKNYWNLANLTGDAAGKTCAFMYAKPPYLVLKSNAPFSKCQG